MNKTFKTHTVAKLAGIHRDTLLRWLREGKIPEPARDKNNWRVFNKDEADQVVRYANQTIEDPSFRVSEAKIFYLPYSEQVESLKKIDWDFTSANTNYLNHAIHPYPCKYIPQIPNTLIQALSTVGETICDPFCGSGTTLVEALRLGRNAIGIDANPLATLICKSKTGRISETEVERLSDFATQILNKSEYISTGQLSLFSDLNSKDFPSFEPEIDKWIKEWFDGHVIKELSYIKKKCLAQSPKNLKEIALVAFSSILVSVSRQDSDTRYVRKDKNIKSGETLKRFARALRLAVNRTIEFTAEIHPNVSAQILNSNVLKNPQTKPFDLLVCSPPYPNAYSYHLYHRSRMLWLDMNQPRFKKEEIGSHRKYSMKSNKGATVDTFMQELTNILEWIREFLKTDRHACFVIGDSIIKGKKIKNDELLTDVAQKLGFKIEANLNRNILSTKKAFNPSIGKIKDEHIVILRNSKKAII